MIRIVLDTNVIINADRGEGSYGKRILDLVIWGEVEAIISESVRREKQLLLDRLVSDQVLRQSVKKYFNAVKKIEPDSIDIILEDQEDVKLLELAVSGEAQFLITDDAHLLVVSELKGVKIVRPSEFWQWWQVQQDKTGVSWHNWAKTILQ